MNILLETERRIENGIVAGYKAIENGVVSGYKKIEDKFVATFLKPDGISYQNDEYSETSDSFANESAKANTTVEDGLLTGYNAIKNSVTIGFNAIQTAFTTGNEKIKNK
jgi:hypothetical protein